MSKLMGVEQLFEGRHFDREVIILCVRWYLRFKLSLRDLVEIMAERGLSLAHTTIMRWVWRYAPEFEKRWKRFAQAVGRSWRVDEKYVKIRGEWGYLYRAVDRAGRTVDFRLSAKRDVAAAKAFFRKAIKGQHDAPRTITLDGCGRGVSGARNHGGSVGSEEDHHRRNIYGIDPRNAERRVASEAHPGSLLVSGEHPRGRPSRNLDRLRVTFLVAGKRRVDQARNESVDRDLIAAEFQGR